jgi:hypothetical protein
MIHFDFLPPTDSLRRFGRYLPAMLMLLVALSISLEAQTVSRVGNRDIAAHVVTSPKQGRFWITGGSDYGDTLKFLYASGASFITSNIVFRVSRGGVTSYYCNLPSTGAPAIKPINPETGQPIPFRAFDSSYVSVDTIALLYKDIDGFYVTLRFMPEKRRTIYDRGSDMLIEFEYRDSNSAQPGELGILMMLDTYNNNATSNSGGGTGDNASFVSSNGYFPSGNFGAKFAQPTDSIPYWYHAGNFKDVRPLNTLFPIHRLRDTSHGGRSLTTPNIVAFGSWLDFRSVGWNVPADVGGRIFNDAASIVRWDTLKGTGRVVTAFGMSDRAGNDMFTCRDSALFIDIRTERLVRQNVIGGPYSRPRFDVEMWVTNTSALAQNVSIDLITPIYTYPLTAGRLMLDPGSPRAVAVQLGPYGTARVRWTLVATPGAIDSPDSIDAQLQFNYFYGTGNSRVFSQACSPTITLIDKRKTVPPVERDTIPPVVERSTSGEDPQIFREFKVYDRHAGYRRDSGIDMIVVDQTRTTNFGFEMSGGTRCDTTSTYRPRFIVIDIRRNARLHFDVFDCAGNVTRDSLSYFAPSDTMPPVVVRTTHRIDPDIYWELDAFDRHAGYRYDSGIDRIVVDQSRSSNFGLTMEGVTRCDTLSTLKPRFTVIDRALPGVVHFDVYDCAGNLRSDSIIYSNDPTVGVPFDGLSSVGTLSIASIAPNPARGREVLVTLREVSTGSLTATLISVDGREMPCNVSGSAGSILRITLPESPAGGRYLLRVSSDHGSDAMALVVP